MVPIKVGIKQGRGAKNFELPAYETENSAGLDLRSVEKVELQPGSRALVPTGIFIELPHGFEAQIRPRSGLAIKHGITVLNSPGTIDSDYRGEIKVILVNHGEKQHTINVGDRIAQMVVAQVTRIEWCERDSLSETERGSGGFGSTGAR